MGDPGEVPAEDLAGGDVGDVRPAVFEDEIGGFLRLVVLDPDEVVPLLPGNADAAGHGGRGIDAIRLEQRVLALHGSDDHRMAVRERGVVVVEHDIQRRVLTDERFLQHIQAVAVIVRQEGWQQETERDGRTAGLLDSIRRRPAAHPAERADRPDASRKRRPTLRP